MRWLACLGQQRRHSCALAARELASTVPFTREGVFGEMSNHGLDQSMQCLGLKGTVIRDMEWHLPKLDRTFQSASDPHTFPAPNTFLTSFRINSSSSCLKSAGSLWAQCFGRQNETTNRYKQHLSIASRIQIMQDTNKLSNRALQAKSSHSMATWVITK